MKTSHCFSLVQITILHLILFGNAIIAQNQNIAPPGIFGNQNKQITPKFISLDSFVNCSTVNNSFNQLNIIPTTIVNQTIWNGTSWNNGFPNTNTIAVINANFESADIIEANSIEINEGASFTLHAGGILKLNQPIPDITKSKLNLLNGSGLLIKTTDSRNPNSVLSTFERIHSKYVNQYTGVYMSSPVSGQEIGSTNASSAYSQSVYNSGGYLNIFPSEIMLPGIGYTETGNGNGDFTGVADALTGSDYRQKYVGSENTSTYPVSLNGAGNYNLVGNPYASYLDADSFLQDPSNSSAGTIYLWTHNTLASTSGNGEGTFRFTTNDFAVYNLLGGVNAGRNISPSGPSGTENFDIPDGKIAFGTGFFLLGNGSATFKPTMTTPIGSQIYRTSGHNRVSGPSALIAPPARHRIWLNLNGFGNSYRQTMIGYATGATLSGIDKFDSPTIDQTSSQPVIDLYSLAVGSTTKLAIQGYSLSSMQNTDSFQLGYKTNGGIFTFTSSHDGIFNSKPYYIFDATDGQYHTLPYTFTTVTGTFNNRFKVVFENLIGFVAPANVCGSQLTNVSNSVFAQNIGAPNYRFEIRTGAPFPNGMVFGEFNGISASQPFVRNLNISGIQYNTNYWLRAATYQVDGVWQYGPTCMVTSPPPPTSKLTDSTPAVVGSCNSTISNYNTTLFCYSPNEIAFSTSGYRFQVSTSSTFATGTIVGLVEKTVNSFSLSQLRPSYQPQPSTVYYVRIQIRYNNSGAPIWQVDSIGNPIYGPICTVTTTANATGRFTDTVPYIFEAKAYPNPFANNFKLDINTSSREQIELQVFDMIGRQIESRSINISDLDNQEIGEAYNSGVYNVVVKQGENLKTLRMIKR